VIRRFSSCNKIINEVPQVDPAGRWKSVTLPGEIMEKLKPLLMGSQVKRWQEAVESENSELLWL